MDEMKGLRTGWFGLKRTDVVKHFRTMKRLQELEISELNATLQSLKDYNMALRKQLESFGSIDTQEAAVNEETLGAVEVVAVEVEARTVFEEEMVIIEETMVTEEESVVIEETMAIVETVVMEESEVLKEQTNEEEAVAEAAAEVELEVEPEVEAIVEEKREEIVPVIETIRTSNVVEFRRRMVEVTEQAIQPVEQQAEQQAERRGGESKRLAAASSMGFWGSANEVMDQVWQEDAITTALHEVSASAAPYAPIRDKEEPKRVEPKEEPKIQAQPTQTPIQKPEPTPTSPPQQQSTTGSAAISEEIRSLRSKYIVGKWAGEDLYGTSGKRIAVKGAVITDEIVEQADRAGKLAELIVNMIIPGLGD